MLNEQTSENSTPVSEPKSTIKIEGQSFEQDASLEMEDKIPEAVLRPQFASIENATITREVK